MSNESSIVSKVWSFANVLRDDGVSYGDYLEQLTYLLFLNRPTTGTSLCRKAATGKH